MRRCIGWVSQDVFLFHGTVAENTLPTVAFNATDAEIARAAKSAEADEFIATLPQGYDTIIGERGQKLSGGTTTAFSDRPCPFLKIHQF